MSINSNSSSSNQTTEYYSIEFESINEELRQRFLSANVEIEKAKQHVNELVTIVHGDNTDWTIKKICNYIAGKNGDLEEFGFSARTIERYLNKENRQLVH